VRFVVCAVQTKRSQLSLWDADPENHSRHAALPRRMPVAGASLWRDMLDSDKLMIKNTIINVNNLYYNINDFLLITKQYNVLFCFEISLISIPPTRSLQKYI